MAETRMILKGGEQEVDLLEKAKDYYNTILPKHWKIKENNTIDLILRHPERKDGFILEEKKKYKIEDILDAVENHRKRQFNKQIDHTSANHKEGYLSAYADYIAKRDSEIIINSKKENDMENITPKQEQNTNMIGGTIREIAGKSLTDKDYLHLFDEGTKNAIEMYLKATPNAERIKLTPQDNLAMAERWQQEINNPTEMSKGMTIDQIAEKEANYHSLYNHGIKQIQNLQSMETLTPQEEIVNEIQEKFNPKEKAFLELKMIEFIGSSKNALGMADVGNHLTSEEIQNVNQYLSKLEEKYFNPIEDEDFGLIDENYNKLLSKVVYEMETNNAFMNDVNPIF